MKLYHHPGACSLSSQIALREAGRPFETEDVDLESKCTAGGGDFTAINPKGYVPALQLDNGELLTETLAVLDYIATRYPVLAPGGPLGRTRLLETLAYKLEVEQLAQNGGRGLAGQRHKLLEVIRFAWGHPLQPGIGSTGGAG